MNSLNLKNHFLIAQEAENNSPFYRTVIYICEHNTDGAMGFVLNRSSSLFLDEIFTSLEITIAGDQLAGKPVLLGGPCQETTGFILHKSQGEWSSSFEVGDEITVTTSQDILKAMANNTAPEPYQMILGYSGWDANQLEHELEKGYWLTCPADADIVFNLPLAERYDAAIRLLGIDPIQLVSEAGHA